MSQWLYTDSSAMVKRYRVEEGRDEFEQAARGAVLVGSQLVATEVSRALVVGADDEIAGEVARDDWEADWLAHDVVVLTRPQAVGRGPRSRPADRPGAAAVGAGLSRAAAPAAS